MSLDDLTRKIMTPFVDQTLSNLGSMAGMKGHSDDGFHDQVEDFRFKGYAICAETRGGIDGVMLMHHYIETAVAMGNAVRKHAHGESQEFNEINEAMADALSEWANTVIGRASRALGESRLNIRFEPPYFVYDTDTMKSVLTGVTDIITVPVHVDDVGRFYFNFLIRSIDQDTLSSDEATETEDDDIEDFALLNDGGSRSLPRNSKILVVDDMKMIRKSMKLYLKEMGFGNVIEAGNGREALEQIEAEEPDFIFIDLVMPEMNGDEALEELRGIGSDIPAVVLTSVADKEVIDDCASLGVDGYIIKPLTTDTGPGILRKFLG